MKSELEQRPLLISAVALICGIAFFRFPPSGVVFLALLVYLTRWPSRVMVVGMFLVGWCIAPKGVFLTEDRFVDANAKVVVKTSDSYCLVRVGNDLMRLGLERVDGVQLFQTVHVIGIAKPPAEGSQDRYAPLGIVGDIQPARIEVVQEAPWIYQASQTVRKAFTGFTHKTLDEQNAAWVDSVCVGDAFGIDTETWDQLKATGIIHLVVVSGFQVVLVGEFVLLLLSTFPIARNWQLAVFALCLSFYAMVAGLESSVTRAAVMVIAGACATLVRRERDLLSSLGLVCIVYLLWRPFAVFSMGFQLSMVTLASFAILLPVHRELPSIRGKALKALAASTTAYGVCSPITAYVTGLMPLLTIPLGSIIAGVISFVTIIGFVGFVLSLGSPVAGSGVLLCIDPLVTAVREMVRVFSDLPFSTVQMPAFSVYWLWLFYGSLLMFWRRRVVRSR